METDKRRGSVSTNRSGAGTWVDRVSKFKSNKAGGGVSDKGKNSCELGQSKERCSGPVYGPKGGTVCGEGSSKEADLGQTNSNAEEGGTQVGGVGSISGPFSSIIVEGPEVLRSCSGDSDIEDAGLNLGVEPNTQINKSRTEHVFDTDRGEVTGCAHMAEEGASIPKEVGIDSSAIRKQRES